MKMSDKRRKRGKKREKSEENGTANPCGVSENEDVPAIQRLLSHLDKLQQKLELLGPMVTFNKSLQAIEKEYDILVEDNGKLEKEKQCLVIHNNGLHDLRI